MTCDDMFQATVYYDAHERAFAVSVNTTAALALDNGHVVIARHLTAALNHKSFNHFAQVTTLTECPSQ